MAPVMDFERLLVGELQRGLALPLQVALCTATASGSATGSLSGCSYGGTAIGSLRYY